MWPALLLSASTVAAAPGEPPRWLTIRVAPGAIDRAAAPATATLPAAEVPEALRAALRDGPKGLTFHAGPTDGGDGPRADRVVQAELVGDGSVAFTWISPAGGRDGPGLELRTSLAAPELVATPGPWTLDEEPGSLRLRHRGRDVFRYNTSPVQPEGQPAILARDAYIGPAFTPAGALITGDFSKFHPHHRGLFLAYAHARVGAVEPDFWNIQNGTGKVVHQSLEEVAAGPVAARFVANHRWEAKGKGAVLRERWEVVAYDIPDSPYWLIDLTAVQRAVAEPVELLPYRYGGMAYRGPEPFVKGALDVLTSEGAGRRERDRKPARWVDLTGPVAEGADRYGGAAILDHPSNPGGPTVARIHPTTLPFFCFVPAHDAPLTIREDAPTAFRYRILIHDGRPDRDRNERLWNDFAAPVAATARAVGD